MTAGFGEDKPKLFDERLSSEKIGKGKKSNIGRSESVMRYISEIEDELEKNCFERFRAKVAIFFWGEDYNYYNTVVTPASCIRFEFMQFTRNLSLIILLVLNCLFFFIFVKRAFVTYMWYPLFSSFLAFLFLFIGSGKQKCYQIKVNSFWKYHLDFHDLRKKQD